MPPFATTKRGGRTARTCRTTLTTAADTRRATASEACASSDRTSVRLVRTTTFPWPSAAAARRESSAR